MSDSLFSKQLLAWFDQYGRKDLPWQSPGSPYHVWLSEIMLQQTQVSTVIPYFQRFIERFPDIDSLADADTDAVLSLWAGLGYYARGRNLHRAAIMMQQQHQGAVPADFETLRQLPGIGRSTAGAIMALGFGQPYPILDGNVRRVLARYDAITTWPGEKKTEHALWQRAEMLLPSARLKDYTQAQMDLGATVCTRSRPKCEHCPLSSRCQAFQLDATAKFPVPRPKTKIPQRKTYWLVQHHDNQLYVEQRAERGIWGGLWSFPEFSDLENLQQACGATAYRQLPTIRHVFTHFKLDIVPIWVNQDSTQASDNTQQTRWVKMDDFETMPVPAPVATFVRSLITQTRQL